MFRIGSLFSGSGGFELAATMCGGFPVWASEIEPYPIAVTKSRFPNMKHLGSVTDVKGNEVEPVDVITFGSPCQDLSVAGKRAGLKHEDNGDEETTRSGLFMEAVRIIKEMREATNGVYPRFAVWENVPGAFSSNKGEDFRTVCEELIKIVEPGATMPAVPKNGWPYADCYCGDGWSLAYRVYDAQYWGVPQRRRRIYLVADFGGECAGQVSFEREGLRGYFETGRTPWQAASGDAERGSGTANCEGKCYGIVSKGNGEAWPIEEKHMALTCGGGQAGQGYPCAMVPYTLKIRSGCEGGGKGALIQTDKSATLATNNDKYLFQPVTLEPGIAQREGGHIYEGVSGTLRAGVVPGCVFSVENYPADSRVNLDESGKVQTLTSRMGTGGGNVPMVMEPVAYNGENITSPFNKVNPQPGDPCHTLGTDSRNYLVQPVYCLQGNGIDRADTAGCNGKGVKEDICYTLNTIDRPAVAYCMDVGLLNSAENQAPPMLARQYKDPHLVCYWDGGQTTGTLTANNAGGNQRMPDKENFNCVVEQTPIVLDRAFFNQGQNAAYDPQFYQDGTVPTLVARGPSAVQIRYIVRRLTPTECARLQGFADAWAVLDRKDQLTDEEYHFWLTVRNTHAEINGKALKDYTKAQMLTWYNKLHTDSSEYKLWGNGIALPTALYVMQGIFDVLKGESINV